MERPLYAFTDIHGNLDLFDKINDIVRKNNGYAYFLGDACDRGPYGYDIMNKLLLNKGRYCYIKGNHEDLFVKAARAIWKIRREEGINTSNPEAYSWDDDVRLSLHNGGWMTLFDWMEHGCNMHFINQIDKLPLWHNVYFPFIKKSITLIHGSPSNDQWKNKLENNRPLLWGRDFNEKWNYSNLLIHGHTPCQLIPQEVNTNKSYPCFYADGTRINLDAGTPSTHKIVLMNLADEIYEIISEKES